jgi:hypothetical protein
MMELRQIRSFLSIAETVHFGRTAEMIHLSQPALSLQIRGLEDEISEDRVGAGSGPRKTSAAARSYDGIAMPIKATTRPSNPI